MSDDYLCDCGHVDREHSWTTGCGHTVTLREKDEPRQYVCACAKQPGEIVGIDGVRVGERSSYHDHLSLDNYGF